MVKLAKLCHLLRKLCIMTCSSGFCVHSHVRQAARSTAGWRLFRSATAGCTCSQLQHAVCRRLAASYSFPLHTERTPRTPSVTKGLLKAHPRSKWQDAPRSFDLSPRCVHRCHSLAWHKCSPPSSLVSVSSAQLSVSRGPPLLANLGAL